MDETARCDQLPERRRRLTLELLVLGAVALLGWTVLLGLTLPSTHEVHQWRASWVGFDALLIVSLAATAILGWRRHRAVVMSGLATAVLLICDAWFDVSLDFGSRDIVLSGALAVFVELPMAALLIRRAYVFIAAAPPRSTVDAASLDVSRVPTQETAVKHEWRQPVAGGVNSR